MASKHQRHLMDVARRKRAREMANEIEHANPLINQQETAMHDNIDKAKKFVIKHKKYFIIGGAVLAGVALAAVAHKMVRNKAIDNTIKSLSSTIGFQPASIKAVKKEMKLELKGSTKRNLQRARFKFPATNHYFVAEDGAVMNLNTHRFLTPLLDNDGVNWIMGFADDTHWEVNTLTNLVNHIYPQGDVQVTS
jgi:hypothetical protein